MFFVLYSLNSNSDTPKRKPSGTPLLIKTLSSDSDAGRCEEGGIVQNNPLFLVQFLGFTVNYWSKWL